MKPRFKRKKIAQSNLPIKKSKPIVKTKSKTKSNIKNGNGNNGRLTLKQSKFVEALLLDPNVNGTHAALAAGYSKKGVEVRASELLNLIKIQDALAKGRKRLSATSRMNQEWVLKRYEMLADYCIDDFFNDDGTIKPFSEIPKDKLYAIGGFKQSKKTITDKDKTIITDRIKEFKLPDKKSVLDSVGKFLGMDGNNEKDKGRGNTFIGHNIQVNLVNNDNEVVE